MATITRRFRSGVATRAGLLVVGAALTAPLSFAAPAPPASSAGAAPAAAKTSPARASKPVAPRAPARPAAPVDLSASLPAWRCPTPVVRTLSNGLRVAVFPNARLPLVHIHLLSPAGDLEEGSAPKGIAYLTSQMLRRGTTSRDAATVLGDLERLGGALAAAASRDYATVIGEFLARDFEAGIELMSDIVVNPIFTEDDLLFVKSEAQRSLLQRRLNPGSVADEHIWAEAFGGHPYARELFGTAETMQFITREQVRTFYQDHWVPGASLLVIGGDVTPERAFALAEERFGRWASRRAAPVTPAAVSVPTTRRIRILNRPDIPVSEVRVGFLLPPATSEDNVALSLATTLLGSGPTARLESPEIRRRFGRDLRRTMLQLRDGGLFTCGATVRTDSVGSALRFLCGQLREFAEQPPAPEALARAQRIAQNTFPIPFETVAGLISQWMGLQFLGQGPETIDSLPARIAAVTSADVARAARRWLDPDHASIVVVGPAEKLRPQLEGLGTVEVVRLEMPQMTAMSVDTAATTPERLEQGRQTLERGIAAHGGLTLLNGIHDSTIDAQIALKTGGRSFPGHMTQVRKEPYRMVYRTRFETLESIQVLNGSKAWSVTGSDGQVEEVDSVGVFGLRSSFRSDVAHMLLDAAAPGSRVVYHGEDRVERTPVDVLDVTLGTGESRRYCFDREKHLLFAVDVLERGASGQSIASRRLYRDYRLVQGVQWPFVEERQLEGETAMQIQFESVKVNTGVTEMTFNRPAAPAPTEP